MPITPTPVSGSTGVNMADLISMCQRFTLSSDSRSNLVIKTAIKDAYRELCKAHDWPWHLTRTKLFIPARLSQSVSLESRTATFTSAFAADTWEGGHLRFTDQETYYYIKDVTGTTVTLEEDYLGEDKSAGACHIAFLRHSLPTDFRKFRRPQADEYWNDIEQVDVDGMLYLQRSNWTTGQMRWFCIAPDYDTAGNRVWCVHVWPYHDVDQILEFWYFRQPPEIPDDSSDLDWMLEHVDLLHAMILRNLYRQKQMPEQAEAQQRDVSMLLHQTKMALANPVKVPSCRVGFTQNPSMVRLADRNVTVQND